MVQVDSRALMYCVPDFYYYTSSTSDLRGWGPPYYRASLTVPAFQLSHLENEDPTTYLMKVVEGIT